DCERSGMAPAGFLPAAMHRGGGFDGGTTLGRQLGRKIAATLWRIVCVGSWCLLGLWTALAVFFTVSQALWPGALVALGVVALYAASLRERFFVRGRQGLPWREIRYSITALVVTAVVAVWYFGFVTPNPDQEWIPKHARMPHVEVVGD